MTPEDPKDPLAKWIQDSWKPENSDPATFQQGIAHRAQAHRRRRQVRVGAAILALIGFAGIWATRPATTPNVPYPTKTAESSEADNTESDAFWASALSDIEDNEAIPDDYEALSGFFLADS